MRKLVGGMLASMTVVAIVLAPSASAAPPTTFEPALEAQNFAIAQERQTIYDTPEYQAQLTETSALNLTEALSEEAGDPGRLFSDDCAGTAATAAPATCGSTTGGRTATDRQAGAVHRPQRRHALRPRLGDRRRARRSGRAS